MLAGIALAGWPGRRGLREHPTAFYLLIAVLSTLVFVDWPFELWRYVYWLPGFNFIRVPSRFIILTMLALSVLAALGFERISARSSPRGRSIAFALIGVLLMAEYSSYPFAGVPYIVDVPAIARATLDS